MKLSLFNNSGYRETGPFIKDACGVFMERTFLIVDNVRITYNEFYNMLLATKKFLNDKGLRQGDRAIIRINNSAVFVIVFFTMLLDKIIPCPVSSEQTETVLNLIAEEIGSDTVIEKGPAPIGSAKDIGGRGIRIRKMATKTAKRPVETLEKEVAYIAFTSGSTGMPKGIKISHRNIMAEIEGMIAGYQLNGDDTHLCVLPLYHASALYRNLLMPLALGSSVVIKESFSAERFWPEIAKHRISFVQVVPTILRVLLQQNDHPPATIKEHLRYIGSASAPHPLVLVEKFEERFGITVLQGYGMSEATCGITLNPVNKEERLPGSVGKPLPHNKIRILSGDGKLLPAGKSGMVQVRGENIMLGYLREDADDKIKINRGWLETGDYGYLDEERNLFLLGRHNDIIKRGGYRIFAISIENEILKCQGVSGAAVISIAHELVGQEIICYVTVVERGPSRKEIFCHLRKRLPSYQLPSDIIFIDELPMLGMGKIDRQVLHARYEAMRKEYQKLN